MRQFLLLRLLYLGATALLETHSGIGRNLSSLLTHSNGGLHSSFQELSPQSFLDLIDEASDYLSAQEHAELKHAYGDGRIANLVAKRQVCQEVREEEHVVQQHDD